MIELDQTISQIEALVEENTARSLTYAALECRLTIERICYERLRIAHDYISHDDLKRWQPRDVINRLIQEVDSNVVTTLTLSIAKERPKGSPPPTLEEFGETEYLPIGTQIGFDPKRIGSIWNALANLALHVSLPKNKNDGLSQYGNVGKIKKKVLEAVAEIQRINEGTLLMSSGVGEEFSFDCDCGAKNKRRSDCLTDGQTISCINPDCHETYEYFESDGSVARRAFEITCKKCEVRRDIPKKMVERMRTDQNLRFDCEGCGETVYVFWRPMQGQKLGTTSRA